MTEEMVKKNWLQDKIFGIMALVIGALIAFSVNNILQEIRSVKIDVKEVITIMQGQINGIRNLQETRRDRVVNLLAEQRTKIELNSERIRNIEKSVYK